MQPARYLVARRAALAAAMAGLAALSGLAPSSAGAAQSSILVEVKGAVRGSPEIVNFKGPVHIDSRTVVDGQFGAVPSVELTIDMSGVVGVGASTGARYLTQTREVVSTPLHFDANGEIAIDFTYEASNPKGTPAYGVGHANFRLFFVPPAGALSIGRGWIDSPATVGARQ